MKRYFTFLTFSFLSTTSLLNASKIDVEGICDLKYPATNARSILEKRLKNLQSPSSEKSSLLDGDETYMKARRSKIDAVTTAKIIFEQENPSSFSSALQEAKSLYTTARHQIKKLREQLSPYSSLDEEQVEKFFPSTKEGRLLRKDRRFEEGPLNRASFFNVIGDGDCLLYTLQVRRDTLIQTILEKGMEDTEEAQAFRDIFKGPVAAEKEEMIAFEYRVPSLSKEEFQHFVTLFSTPKAYLPAEFAIAYGHVINRRVYVWEINSKEKTFRLRYEGDNSALPLHIGFVNGNHFQILIDEEAADVEAQTIRAQEVQNRALNAYLTYNFGGDVNENDLFLEPSEKGKTALKEEKIITIEKFAVKTLDLAGTHVPIHTFNVETSKQYGLNMPTVPVIHPYHMGAEDTIIRKDFGMPAFSFAARKRGEELDGNVFPALPDIRNILLKLSIPHENIEYYYEVQNDPWQKCQRLLRPQSWVFPKTPYESNEPFDQKASIQATVLSPNNSIRLVGTQKNGAFIEGGISVHNKPGKNKTVIDPLVISSGGGFPALEGLGDNQTSFFVSIIVDKQTQRTAVTFHTILNDEDFNQLNQANIENIQTLQEWLANCFKGASRSHPYGKFSWASLAQEEAHLHSNSQHVALPSSSPMTYEDYFKDFLPKMGDACRAYNGFKKTDEEILAILFRGLPKGTYPDLETATKKFAELARNGRTYANLFDPPSFISSSPMTYEDYFKDFLPKMGDACRAYNKFEKTDEEILAILFRGLPKGTYPDLETATKKFAELARNGRTYAKLFDPPSFISSSPMTYEDYFKDFLPKMGDACRAYNGFKKTDEEILAILFRGLPKGTYPDLETATKKFAELARNGRTYANLFDPPSDL